MCRIHDCEGDPLSTAPRPASCCSRQEQLSRSVKPVCCLVHTVCFPSRSSFTNSRSSLTSPPRWSVVGFTGTVAQRNSPSLSVLFRIYSVERREGLPTDTSIDRGRGSWMLNKRSQGSPSLCVLQDVQYQNKMCAFPFLLTTTRNPQHKLISPQTQEGNHAFGWDKHLISSHHQ